MNNKEFNVIISGPGTSVDWLGSFQVYAADFQGAVVKGIELALEAGGRMQSVVPLDARFSRVVAAALQSSQPRISTGTAASADSALKTAGFKKS
jgi:hypothetical protein